MPSIHYFESASFKHIHVKTRHYCIELINRGATVKTLKTPNRDGVFENIILTYNDLNDYKTNKKMLGTTVGPYAGRIAKPYPTYFQYQPKEDVLLHSDTDNLALQDFEVSVQSNQVTFTLNGDNVLKLFPKQFQFRVIYTFLEEGFDITFETHASEDGVANVTNHMYFNLSGASNQSVHDHELSIPASHAIELNPNGLPKNRFNVKNTVFDFQASKPLRDALNYLSKTDAGGLDHPFILDKNLIMCREPSSGREIRVETDYDALVVFTNNEATEAILENGVKDTVHGALCLEPLHIPNDIHFLDYPKSFMKANTVKRQTIAYRFSTL